MDSSPEGERMWAMARQEGKPGPGLLHLIMCPGSPRLLVLASLMASESLGPPQLSGRDGQYVGKPAGLGTKGLGVRSQLCHLGAV